MIAKGSGKILRVLIFQKIAFNNPGSKFLVMFFQIGDRFCINFNDISTEYAVFCSKNCVSTPIPGPISKTLL